MWQLHLKQQGLYFFCKLVLSDWAKYSEPSWVSKRNLSVSWQVHIEMCTLGVKSSANIVIPDRKRVGLSLLMKRFDNPYSNTEKLKTTKKKSWNLQFYDGQINFFRSVSLTLAIEIWQWCNCNSQRVVDQQVVLTIKFEEFGSPVSLIGLVCNAVFATDWKIYVINEIIVLFSTNQQFLLTKAWWLYEYNINYNKTAQRVSLT